MADAARRSALLDASVLYPALLRNILMHFAMRDLFSAFWSQRIQDEWTTALLRDRPDLSKAAIARTRRLMDEKIESASVSGYEHLMETIDLPDVDDRHVLAAAIQCGADIIVTANLRDFPVTALSVYQIEPQHPDAFILSQVRAVPDEAIAAMRDLRADWSNPPMTAAALLGSMSRQGLVASANALAAFADLL